MPDPGLYSNPNEIDATNPQIWYHNGILENYVNPVNELTFRGEGALLPMASDDAITIVPDEYDMVMPTPGMNMQGYVPQIATHEGAAEDTSEPRSMTGLKATETYYEAPSQLDRITALFSGSPIAALFLGLAALVAFNSFVLKSGRVGRAASRTGASAAGVGTGIAAGTTQTTNSGIEAVNDAIGSAAEAVEGVTSGT